MEFDLQSLRPTYHLLIGLPGRSNALAIAARLGLEQAIVEKARAMLSSADLEAERLLDEIHAQRQLTRKDRNEAETTRQQAMALQEELSRRLAGIEKEREDILLAAQAAAEAELEKMRDELRKIKREFSQSQQSRDDLKAAETQAETIERSLEESLRLPDKEFEASEYTYKKGDTVLLRTIDAEGVIKSLDRDQAEVQVGRLRVRANLNELLPVKAGAPTKRSKAARKSGSSGEGRSISPPIADSPPLELHVHGWTVDDALEELDRRLDAAFLAGMPYIRVIHGKGTGRLRSAIRQALAESPYVASFESGQPSEGGDGVTVVHLNVT